MRGAGLGLRGPGGARPPRHVTTAAAAVFVQLALRWGRNWAAQWQSQFWGRNWAALDTDLTRNTRAPHFTPQHWLLCHMGLY